MLLLGVCYDLLVDRSQEFWGPTVRGPHPAISGARARGLVVVVVVSVMVRDEGGPPFDGGRRRSGPRTGEEPPFPKHWFVCCFVQVVVM